MKNVTSKSDRPIIESGDYWRRSWAQFEQLKVVDRPRVVELRQGQQVPVFSQAVDWDSGKRKDP